MAIYDPNSNQHSDGSDTESCLDNFRYLPVSPDGFPFFMDEENEFATEQEARDAIPKIIRDRYTHQGYYSTSNRTRLSLDEAIAACSVISYNATDEEE